MEQRRTTHRPAGLRARPVHLQLMAVLADGSVRSYELPVEPCDRAELTVEETAGNDYGWDERGPAALSKTVEVVAKVTYHNPADRPGGGYRTDTYGGAAPFATPGRDVPDHIVAMIAQNLGFEPAGMMRRGSPAYATAVRAHATMLAQRIWLEAHFAGMLTAEQMGMFRQRVVVSGPDVKPAPISMPLFNDQGRANWTPTYCLYDRQTGENTSCGMMTPVEKIEPFLASLTDGERREVIARPCGHTIWLPDPMKFTLS